MIMVLDIIFGLTKDGPTPEERWLLRDGQYKITSFKMSS